MKQVAPQELYTPTSVNTTSFVKKIRYVLLALVVLTPLGLLAEGTAFGEWSADELAEMMNNVPAGIENGFSFEASSVITRFQEQTSQWVIFYQPSLHY